MRTRYHTEPSKEVRQFFNFRGEKTKKDKQKYIADYHREYRKVGLNQDYYEALRLLNLVLRQGNVTSSYLYQLSNITCCTYSFLIDHLGLNSEQAMNEFRNGDYEIDHLIPKKWFKENPEYVHYMNHWSNLVISSKEANRKKSGSLDGSNDVVNLMLERMKLEILQAEIALHFSNPADRAAILQPTNFAL